MNDGTSWHECPLCVRGMVEVITCPGGAIKDIACTFCGGTGVVGHQKLERYERGRLMRAERLARGITQRERAAELGMGVVEYSRLENGREEQPE